MPAKKLPAEAEFRASASEDLPRLCRRLSCLEIPAGRIGLPTWGATVISTQWVGGAKDKGRNGPHCELIGGIHSDARSAATVTPDIRFQVNLPLAWNGKSVHMGGEAYDGQIVSGTVFL